MSLNYRSIQSGTGTASRPSSTAKYDLLIARVICNVSTTGGIDPTVVPPSDTSPWTLLTQSTMQTNSGGGGVTTRTSIAVLYKIAGASEPSSYTFTVSGGTVSNNMEYLDIIRVLGAPIVSPISAYASGTSGTFSTSYSFSGITPTVADSMLIQFYHATGNSATASGYAIATSDPSSWHEVLDEVTGTGNRAIAYATRPEITATGSYSATLSVANDKKFGAIIAISPSLEPVVTTEAVSSISLTTATANGTVNRDNGIAITERGLCWSTTTSPTVADSSGTSVGTVGSFTVPMTSLTPGATYYVRSYAVNTNGTFYGDQVQFTALSASADEMVEDINAVEGETYAIQFYVGGSTGSVTVKLGSTGYSETFAAGSGTVEMQGIYAGVGELIFTSVGFDGYIDNVYHVLVLGDATIDWSLSSLTNVYPINSSVVFRRIEDNSFNRFRVYRYLDVQFKDLDAYVTVLLEKEANEGLVSSTKEFLVSNTSDDILPFINKKISTLFKAQALRVGLSNNRLSERFTVCQFIVRGIEQPAKEFAAGKIISIG